jgi:acyl dehydratase
MTTTTPRTGRGAADGASRSVATFVSPGAVLGAVGATLGPGEWLAIDQARIDRFADTTDDHQWIHVDGERAANGRFGAPIAHGFLTLSLLTALATPLLDVGGVSMRLNLGFERVRFLQPVTAGSRVRVEGTITSAARSSNGIRLTQDLAVEVEGAERPALVAQWVTLLVPSGA